MKEKGEERRKIKIEAQRKKPPIPTRAIDALIGDKEQNGKHKKEKERKRKKQGAGT